VRIGDFSLELCGGTHVRQTGDIGPFQLVGEGSVSAGVRRLEAITALEAQKYYRNQSEVLDNLSRLLRVSRESLLDRVQRLLEENRQLKSKRPAERSAPEGGFADGPGVKRERIGSVLFLSGTLGAMEGKALREAYDRFKSEADELIVVLFSRAGEKVQALVGVSPKLVSRGWDARKLLEACADRIGAKGGGRPDLAQAGASGDASALEGALSQVRSLIMRQAGD